jgi:hypothetical protein
MEAANTLNYAPKPSARGRTIRRLFIAASLLALIVGAGLWLRSSSSTLRIIYLEHKCLTFVEPAGQVNYETNNARILHQNSCPPLNAFTGYPTGTVGDRIFLHELRRPDGVRRLVCVSVGQPSATEWNHYFQVVVYAWDVTSSPTIVTWDMGNVATGTGNSLSHWKFFAGQPDLQNRSHFTFEYELDGNRHTCDAWLGNDDKLLISQRP